jgi:hypothetical protein
VSCELKRQERGKKEANEKQREGIENLQITAAEGDENQCYKNVTNMLQVRYEHATNML